VLEEIGPSERPFAHLLGHFRGTNALQAVENYPFLGVKVGQGVLQCSWLARAH
jgi:hypothetical protein